MRKHWMKFFLFVGIATLCGGAAQAFQLQLSDSVRGSLDMQLTLGAGMRLSGQSADLVGDPGRVSGANTAVSSNGDDGDLNYNQHDLYATYLKFTPELLLKFPDRYKFMARATALYDFKADDTRRTDLAASARDQVARDIQLLDLWVSKDMNIGNQRARIRVGNQVVSWGESLFAIGGINSTNSLDFQKLSIPGTQLKEAVLPAPIISVASGLGSGVNVEAYYQFYWNKNRLPPVGTYFSVADILGKGRQPFFVDVSGGPNTGNFGGLDPAADPSQANTFAAQFRGDNSPKNSGQYGVSMHYKPQNLSLDVGLYFMNYHDKLPVLSLLQDFTAQWTYLEDRKLYGVSANFPLGNWAIGWELSYRPKDAIALSSCFGTGPELEANNNPPAGPVDCPLYIDAKKYQMHLTGLLSLTPGDQGWFLDLVHADTGTFLGEAVWIHYSGVSPDKRYSRNIGGVDVVQVPDAGYGFYQGPPVTGPAGTFTSVKGVGDADSYGYTFDFSLVYDNKIIKGWQVTPGATFFHAVKGYTPTLTANYLSGAKSVNLYILFNQNNPTNWQAGLNYTNFFGKNQLLADRDFIGGFLTRNF